MTTRISSLHDDLLWPCVSHACGMGEMGAAGKRLPVTEKSPIVRAAQFGVRRTDDSAPRLPGEAAYDDYCATLAPAICEHYETVVAAVFDRHFVSDVDSGWPPALPTQSDRERSTYEDITRYHSLADGGLPLARSAEQIHADGPTNMVLAVEGMDFLHSETQTDALLGAGARIFALQYNRPNTLTRGDCTLPAPSGEAELTALGRRVVRRLLAAGAIIDLAHSAPRTRTEILDYAEEQGYGHQVAYTHGALWEEAEAERIARLPGRFLHRAEAERIIGLGGIVGLTPALLFTPSLSRFTEQIVRLCRDTKNGIASVALGTDFGGISEASLLPEIRSVADLGRIGDVLSERHGFADTDVDGILRANATSWLRRVLPSSPW